MSTPRIHRYDFSSLRDFRGPIVIQTAAAAEVEELIPAPPPPPVFSQQDIEAARLAGKKQGYAEGFIAGEQEAKRTSDLRTEESNSVISSLGEVITNLDVLYKTKLQEEAQYLSALVLAVSRKVAGDAITTRGEETIHAIIERCMPIIFSKPRLIVTLNPDMFERTLERIETHLRDQGFEGEIQFKSNPEMGLSDTHLDWGSGQVNHSAATLWAEVETLIERVPLELTFADTLKTNTESTGE